MEKVDRNVMKAMVEDFTEKIQVKLDKYYAEKFPHLKMGVVEINFGRRYAKLVKDRGVYCFIDMTNGDVLKAATWRAPAKHARGNLFAPDGGMNCMGPYGAAYMDSSGRQLEPLCRGDW